MIVPLNVFLRHGIAFLWLPIVVLFYFYWLHLEPTLNYHDHSDHRLQHSEELYQVNQEIREVPKAINTKSIKKNNEKH